MKRIILIDDREELRLPLAKSLEQKSEELKAGYCVEAWNEEQLGKKINEAMAAEHEDLSNAEEDIFYRLFRREENVSLVVSDRDLSLFSSLKVSESSIADACKRLNIPLATYHRRPKSASKLRNFERASQIRSYSVAIDNVSDVTATATQIIDLADGFNFLFDQTHEILIKQGQFSHGPAGLLAYILKKPELEYHFAQYAEGPSVGLDVFTTFSEQDGEENNNKDQKKIEFIASKTGFVLGCWLYNYILNFPGILLDHTSTRAFLNLSEESFDEQCNIFADALYDGPFSGYRQFWWRAPLEEIVYSQDCEDGFELLQKLSISAEPSKCCVTGESPTGYYCLIRKEPISKNASKGNLSWVPKGANLCRVESDAYDALAPMMSF